MLSLGKENRTSIFIAIDLCYKLEYVMYRTAFI